AREIQIAGRYAAGLLWNENAPRSQALQAGRVFSQALATLFRAAAIRLVASAVECSTARSGGDESAAIGALTGNAAGGCIDRPWQTSHPAVEIIPSQQGRGGVACLIVLRPCQMEFAEHRTFVIGFFQQLGRCGDEGRDLGDSEVVWSDCLPDVRTQWILAQKECGPTRGALRHGPRIAETQSRLRDGVHIGHVGRGGTAITE